MPLISWSPKKESEQNQAIYEPENEYAPIRWDGIEDQWILVKLTLDEHKEMLSALHAGATLIYGNDANRVVWHWLKQIEYPYMFCEKMAACILAAIGTDNALDEALYLWLVSQLEESLGSGDSLDQILQKMKDAASSGSSVAASKTPLISNPTCDRDLLYGYTRQLVEMMNSLITDAFQIFEVITNTIEFVQSVTDAIPILTNITDIISYMQDTLVEAYLANYDLANSTEYACDLFCLALETDCTLTWDDLLRYFAGRVDKITTGDIFNMMAAIAVGGYVGDEYVHICHYMLAGILSRGGDWLGISLVQIQQLSQAFFNDPDPDWETQCDECPQGWRATFDFTDSACGFSPGSWGTYIADTGFRTTNFDGTTRCVISLGFASETVHLTQVKATWLNWSYGGTQWFNNLWTAAFCARYSEPILVYPQDGDGEHTRGFSFDQEDDISLDFRTSRVGTGGAATLTKLIVSGVGTPPDAIVNNATLFEYL
jgi:hypothetical protein